MSGQGADNRQKRKQQPLAVRGMPVVFANKKASKFADAFLFGHLDISLAVRHGFGLFGRSLRPHGLDEFVRCILAEQSV
jgi:hypothetical protein